MKRIAAFLFVFLQLLSFLSCRREEIYDLVSKYRIEFEFVENIRYDDPGLPQKICVVFYDVSSGKKVYETYSGSDGCYLYAITPGTYDIIAYALGTQRTHVTYVNDFNLVTAETNVIANGALKTVSSPDHLYAGVVRNCRIPYLSEGDPDFFLKFNLSTVCDDWKIIIDGVRNLEYASSIDIFIDSQWKEHYLGLNKKEGGCILNLRGKKENIVGESIVIPFETFGMMQDVSVKMEVKIMAADGQKHYGVFDISDQVFDPLNMKHIIRAYFDTELKPLTQGGLDPSADDWDENRTTIGIQ